jgi:hypothetical protein
VGAKVNKLEDKSLWVLLFCVVFYTFVTIGLVAARPNDGALYSTFSGILSGFTGALLMHLTGRTQAGTNTSTVTKTDDEGTSTKTVSVPAEVQTPVSTEKEIR